MEEQETNNTFRMDEGVKTSRETPESGIEEERTKEEDKSIEEWEVVTEENMIGYFIKEEGILGNCDRSKRNQPPRLWSRSQKKATHQRIED